MKKSLVKNTLRKIRATFGRFLAILAIIAIGSGFFAGVKATSPDMKKTAVEYYETTRLSHFHMLSTVGFEKSDLEALAEIDGLSGLSAGYSADMFLPVSGAADSIVKVLSYDSQDSLDRPMLVEGRLPLDSSECVIESSTPKPYTIGSTLTLTGENADEYLSIKEFTVVGIVRSSYYVDFERGSTSIGNGVINSFLFVPEDAFDFEYYTDVRLRFQELEGAEAYSDEYNDISDRILTMLEEKAEAFGDASAQRIYDENSPELLEAQQEYEDGLAEYEKAQADYESSLESTKEELDRALTEINANSVNLTDGWKAYADGVDECDTNETKLKENEAELAAKEKELEAAKLQVSQGRTLLKSISTLVSAYAVYQASTPIPSDAAAVIEAAKALDSDEFSVSATLKSYVTAPKGSTKTTLRGVLNGYIDGYDETLTGLQNEIVNGESALKEGKAALAEGKAALTEARETLAATKIELETGDKELAEAKTKYDEAQEEFTAAVLEGQEELDEAKNTLADAKVELDDGFAELQEALDDVKWYAFDRSGYTGYTSFETDADRVDSIAKVFPIFFILVAALVCLNTMARMVEEERTEIGVLKALGYDGGAILSQYLAYAFVASTLGVGIGLTAGLSTIPRVIYNAYTMMYNLPELVTIYPVLYIVGCLVVALLCTGLSALVACGAKLRGRPAKLMRPRAPKSGKRVLLEKIPFIWKHLSFSLKVTARNVFRYKSRVLMTVLGIGGCTALLLTGFTLKYAISAIIDLQYDEVFTYDMLCIFNDEDGAQQEIEATLDDDDRVSLSTCAYQKNYKVSSDASSCDAYIMVVEDSDALDGLITLRDRESGDAVSLTGAGVVINEKLAKLLSVEVGGKIRIDGEELLVTALTENYAFNYVYMTKNVYIPAFGEFKGNVILAELTDSSQETRDELSKELLRSSSVHSINFSQLAGGNFRSIIDKLNYIVVVIIVSSGALAFVVLYNLANINVVERTRELSTIKVLGFFDHEVSAYIYRENIVTAGLGIIGGLTLGRFLAHFVVNTSEVDVVMFAPDIPVWCSVCAGLVTIVFVALVNIVMHYKMKHIDMASGLKAIE